MILSVPTPAVGDVRKLSRGLNATEFCSTLRSQQGWEGGSPASHLPIGKRPSLILKTISFTEPRAAKESKNSGSSLRPVSDKGTVVHHTGDLSTQLRPVQCDRQVSPASSASRQVTTQGWSSVWDPVTSGVEIDTTGECSSNADMQNFKACGLTLPLVTVH